MLEEFDSACNFILEEIGMLTQADRIAVLKYNDSCSKGNVLYSWRISKDSHNFEVSFPSEIKEFPEISAALRKQGWLCVYSTDPEFPEFRSEERRVGNECVRTGGFGGCEWR